jgi:uncharacterized protein (TIGR02246 family)
MISKVTAAIAFAVAVAFSLPAFAGPEEDITAVTQEWAKAFAEHNVEKIVAFYAKDATVWGTNALELRTTPEELRAFFQSTFRIPNVAISFDSQTIRVFGNVAVVAGNYTFKAGSGDQEQSTLARYSFTFLQDGARWLIIDHHSSPMPIPRTGTRRT